jgi:SAM-dependent methyltransferase
MEALLAEREAGWREVEGEDVAASLGLRVSDLPPSAVAALAAADLRYAEIAGAERDACLLQALRMLERDLPVSGPGALARWERGWQENLEAYRRSGDDTASLRPRYYKHTVLRYRGRYIRPAQITFEEQYYTILRHILFHRYLRDAPAVVEFGCGTGTSLLILAELFPDRPLIGYDWTRSSQALLQAIAERTGRRIRGIRCDMFAPPTNLPFPEGAAVMTMAAMEQLGGGFGPLLDFLLAKRPSICLHLEPIVELYDDTALFDYVAIQYHRKRGYLTGFLPALQALESAGRVSILDARRLHFGSCYQEGYSVVVWRVRDAIGDVFCGGVPR